MDAALLGLPADTPQPWFAPENLTAITSRPWDLGARKRKMAHPQDPLNPSWQVSAEGGAGPGDPHPPPEHPQSRTWISSCCTTCICTRHWAVLRSSRACSVLRCLRGTRGQRRQWALFCLQPPPSHPAHSLESRQTKRHKGKEVGGKKQNKTKKPGQWGNEGSCLLISLL